MQRSASYVVQALAKMDPETKKSYLPELLGVLADTQAEVRARQQRRSKTSLWMKRTCPCSAKLMRIVVVFKINLVDD